MKLLRNLLTVTAIALMMGSSVNAASVVINALDVRGNGVFGHDMNIMNAGSIGPGNVTADPLDWVIPYMNLDLDGDGSANDTVTFTLRASGGTNQRAFNQGVDTGFGNLNDVTFSVVNVSGTTTDSGDIIVFDGFTGGAIGAGVGNGAGLDSSAEINGTVASITDSGSGIAAPMPGNFIFRVAAVDFAAPTPTVLYDNSINNIGGSIVARHHDLQFSTVAATIPEPSSLALLGLAGLGFATRRRR